jgi:hypothetical protein
MRHHRSLLVKILIAAFLVSGAYLAGSAALASNTPAAKQQPRDLGGQIRQCKADLAEARQGLRYAGELQALGAKNEIVISADGQITNVRQVTEYLILRHVAGKLTTKQLKRQLGLLAHRGAVTKRILSELAVETRDRTKTIQKHCAALIAKQHGQPPGAKFTFADVKIDPPTSAKPTWKLNATLDGTASWKESPWDVSYGFKLPKTLESGQKATIELSINCTRNDSAANTFSIGVQAEGIQKDNQLIVTAPAKQAKEGSKTLTLSVPASASSGKDIFVHVLVGDGFDLTYHYKR